jgi:hypothetical protein
VNGRAVTGAPQGDLGTLVGRLLALAPGTDAADEERHRIEHLLMTALKRGGRLGGEQLVDSLVAHGYSLERVPGLPSMWRVVIPPPRVLELWFTGGDDPAVAALSYRVGKPWGTKAQKRAARLQAEFYKRYETISREGDPLSPADRLIVLVGDLEAEVNNGGFRQYLENKGTERAKEAVASLKVVGAKRTARWLSSALQLEDDASLDSLDQQFYEKAEDLASLVMAYLARPDALREA